MSLQSERDPGFYAIWAASIAPGVAHDRAVRRRLLLAVPLVIVGTLVYAFLIR